jgi:hypothetical protein
MPNMTRRRDPGRRIERLIANVTGQIENLQKVGDIWAASIIRHHTHLTDERADHAMERLLIKRFTSFKTDIEAAVTALTDWIARARRPLRSPLPPSMICIASYNGSDTSMRLGERWRCSRYTERLMPRTRCSMPSTRKSRRRRATSPASVPNGTNTELFLICGIAH